MDDEVTTYQLLLESLAVIARQFRVLELILDELELEDDELLELEEDELELEEDEPLELDEELLEFELELELLELVVIAFVLELLELEDELDEDGLDLEELAELDELELDELEAEELAELWELGDDKLDTLELDDELPDELELCDELELLELDDELELLDDEVELPGDGVVFTTNTRLPNPLHFTSKNSAPALRVIVSPTNVKTCRPPWASSASQTNDPPSLATWKLTKFLTTYPVVPSPPV